MPGVPASPPVDPEPVSRAENFDVSDVSERFEMKLQETETGENPVSTVGNSARFADVNFSEIGR